MKNENLLAIAKIAYSNNWTIQETIDHLKRDLKMFSSLDMDTLISLNCIDMGKRMGK